MGTGLPWPHLSSAFPSALWVTPCSLEGPGCLGPQGKVSLTGEDRTGDVQQQHPCDSASAFTSAGSEGQTGCTLLQAGDPSWSAVARWCRWAAMTLQVPAPGVGEREGREGMAGSVAARAWGLWEGNQGHSCKHPDVCADTYFF